MTIRLTPFAALLLVLGLAACGEPEAYPVSGEECGPGDPVQSLEGIDCAPVVGGV